MADSLNNEGTTPSEKSQDSGGEVKKDFQGLLGSTRKFVLELLDIRANTDQTATKEAIIADIPF